MKNNTTTLHDERELNNSAGGCKEAKGRQVWKLGLDVDLRQVVVGMQCERGEIGPARKFSREQLIEWVKQKRARGDMVHAVYESCGFGYTLHEELVAAGAHCIVTQADAIEPGAAEKERSDGWARVACAAVALSGWAWPRVSTGMATSMSGCCW
jgi:hypothetical protein